MARFINSPSQVVYNRIKITICDPFNGYIEGRDMYNQPIRLAYSFYYSPYIQVPKIDEDWIVKKIDNNWTLYARFEDKNQQVPISQLSPGDVRIESKNILYVNADQEIVMDFNKAASSLSSLNENTLPGSALFGSGTLDQFSAGTLITTNKFITPLKTSLSTVSVSDGQEERVLISEDNIVWNFRYRANSSSTYKWDFIGGPEYMSFVYGGTAISTSSPNWGNANGSPMLTIPYTGEYIISGGAEAYSSSNNVSYVLGLQLVRGLSTTVPAELPGYVAKDNQDFTVSTSFKLADGVTFSLQKGDILREVYQVSSSTVTFDKRWMKLQPIRVQAT